uniref:Integrase catalytic domain-containing protein n=1 Tax=Oncorhynchus mykiss TaxID=8022 RepID=A0A8K9XKM7_ONCMY
MVDYLRREREKAHPQEQWGSLNYELLSVDFLTDLPPSQGNTTILVVVDHFSKSCRLLPLPGLPTALQTGEALFTHVFRHYGVPEDIMSDRGSQFTSRIWKAFMERLGVSVSLTSGFHPESNGQVERVNQAVGRFLRSYCQDRPGKWAKFMPWAEMAQNLLRHSSTNLSPFQCVLGYQPVLAAWHESQTLAPAVDNWLRHAEETWEATHVHLQRAVLSQKVGTDRHRCEAPVFGPGDRVWLSTRNLPLRLPCLKLGPRFVGPFKVLRRVWVTGYSYPPITVLTPRSMCLSSGRWCLAHSRRLKCGMFLRPLWTSRGSRSTPFDPSWIRDVGQRAFSTSWTGRDTVQRRDAGFRWRTC